MRAGIDRARNEYSSALSFGGWTMTFARPRDYEPLPVSAPQTWLLDKGWKKYGLMRSA